MNNESFFKSHQLVVSHELLQLLHWFVLNEPEGLRMLVSQALEERATEPPSKNNLLHASHDSHEELQQIIIYFFDMMEAMLQEAYILEEKSHSSHQFSSTIDHLDTTLCGENTIAVSVAQAATELHQTKETAREALYKELLKNWHPRNREHSQ